MKPLLLITCLILMSCQAENKKTAKADVDDKFQTFLNQFPKKDLPIQVIGCEVPFESLTELDKAVSLAYEKNEYYIYGIIPSKGDFISTITLAPADCFIPILTTYKLNGEKIDSKAIAINNCGDGPCSQCQQAMEIDSDNTITVVNRFTYNDCDENGDLVSDKVTRRELLDEVKITKDGYILIDES